MGVFLKIHWNYSLNGAAFKVMHFHGENDLTGYNFNGTLTT
jgi:hypothetical protein